MKSLVAAGFAGLVLMTGCAPVTYTKANVDGRVVCNTDTMDDVERRAKKSFASVHWVNCPRMTLRVS